MSKTVNIEVELQNPYSYTTNPKPEQLDQWAKAALQVSTSANKTHTVVVRVVNQEEGTQLNRDYRSKDYATNVLSFPFETPPIELIGEQDEIHLGDLVICEPVLQQEVTQQNKTLQQHWAHLFVHGLLHLQGFDHISDDEADIMETLEIDILGKLGFGNPYQVQAS